MPFIINGSTSPISALYDGGIEVVTIDDTQERVYFPAGSYEVAGRTYEYEKCVLPAAIQIKASRKKIIQRTEIVGRRGAVVEIISTDDWDIEINGIISTGSMAETPYINPNVYPHEEVRALANLMQIDSDIEIIADKLTDMGIHRVVIDSIDFSPVEGFPYLVSFSIKMVSYTPYELELATEGEVALERDFQIYG